MNERMTGTPIAIDVFAGCGGLSLGLKKAGFKVLAAVEIDKRTAETYALNHSEVQLFTEDVRKLVDKDFLQNINISRGNLDLLGGCPPCQGFSVLRRKNRPESYPDERNDLINTFCSLVVLFYPKVVMLENVQGMEKDPRFSQFLKKLLELGYSVDYDVLNLENYGVPQRRKRLVFLASRTGKIPDITKIKTAKTPTVRDTIGNLPMPHHSDNEIHKLVLNNTPLVKKRIAAIPKDGGSRSDLPDELELRCHKESKSKGFKDVYGRLSWNNVSPTITGGCFNPSKGRFIHPEQDRPLSIFEAALLQSFPTDYKFLVRNGICRNAAMIGNALPPKFAEAVSNYAVELL